MAYLGPLPQELSQAAIKVGISFEGYTGEESALKFMWLLAEFTSWRVIELRASIPCWPVAGDYSPFLVLCASPSWQPLHQSMAANEAIRDLILVLRNFAVYLQRHQCIYRKQLPSNTYDRV
jgi:hypothetical protein